jgi:hypothetical protein
MSASKCDRCGETVDDLDAGFSPAALEMRHGCGGTWRVALVAAQRPDDGDHDALHRSIEEGFEDFAKGDVVDAVDWWAHRGDRARCDAHDLDSSDRCERTGVEVRLTCPAGRPDATACYCDEHGGLARAEREARADWNYAAPESVGDAGAVLDAGCDCLRSTEAYVVLRQTTAETGGTWLAWLGLGGHLMQVTNPEPAMRRGRPRTDGRGQYSFSARVYAEQAARDMWTERVARRVAEITAVRGGTLAWGVAVEPLAAPIVILLEQGDTRSAWDIAVTLAPRSRAGQSLMSGLRPSGECA